MAAVTSVKFDGTAKPRGVFKIEKFEILTDDGMEAYAELRNRMADATKGIVHENTREYSRKTTVSEGEGAFTTTEEIILVVQYWENPVKRHKGESTDERERESKYLPQTDLDR